MVYRWDGDPLIMRFALFLMLAIGASFTLAGCGGGARTSVTKPPTAVVHVPTANVVRDTSGVGYQVEERWLVAFEQTLQNNLYTKDGFTAGKDLTLKWHVVSGNEGSAAERAFVGMGAGAGEATMEVSFLDASGTVLATIQVTGSVNSGWFGGSYKAAFVNAAIGASDYAKKTYLAR